MENGPVEIVDLPIDSMVDFFIVFLYVYQRVNGKKTWTFHQNVGFSSHIGFPEGTKGYQKWNSHV